MSHSGHDDLLTVKGHQPKLLEPLQNHFEPVPAPSVDTPTEQTRDRQTQRPVRVLDPVADVDPQWSVSNGSCVWRGSAPEPTDRRPKPASTFVR